MGSLQTLSRVERRIVAVWAADCAERVLGLFEVQAPGDTRPRDAIARTRAFGRGELDVAREIGRRFAGAGAAREASTPAAAAAARAAGQAAAIPHMGAHGLGAAAYAAKAVGLAAPDRPQAVSEEIQWQLRSASFEARAALRSFRQLVRTGPVRWGQASWHPGSLARSSTTSRLACWAPQTDPLRRKAGAGAGHRPMRPRTNSSSSHTGGRWFEYLLDGRRATAALRLRGLLPDESRGGAGVLLCSHRRCRAGCRPDCRDVRGALAARESYSAQLGSPRGWLLGIAAHKTVDALRRGHVEHRAQQQLGMAQIAWSEDDLDYVTRVDRGPLERLLADLPAEQRQAIQAHIVEEVEYCDLARLAGVSEPAMRKRVSRGLAALRRQLTKEPR